MGAQIDWQVLLKKAWTARDKAYARYSNFKVGAALLTESGLVFMGCNVENASYGLTICAERVAATAAVASGIQKFSALALAAETGSPVLPCGACRQFLAEFNPALPLCSGSEANFKTYLLSDIFPSPFLDFRGH